MELQQTYLLVTESQQPTVFHNDYLWGVRRDTGLGLSFTISIFLYCLNF